MKIRTSLYQFKVQGSDKAFTNLRKKMFADDVNSSAEAKAEEYRNEAQKDTGRNIITELLWKGEVEVENQASTKSDVESNVDSSYFEVNVPEGYEFEEEVSYDDYPRGWHRRKEFVDSSGRVYHSGVEVDDLYRKRLPTQDK